MHIPMDYKYLQGWVFLFLGAFMTTLFFSCDTGYTKHDYKEKEWYKKIHGLEATEKPPTAMESQSKEKGITSVMEFKKKDYPDTEEGKRAAFGEKLIMETYDYFLDGQGNNINNQLACASCHVYGGTKTYGIPFVGLAQFYPAYMGRENEERNLAQRINGCFERSMDGQAIDEDSPEMIAILAYIDHLSQDVAVEKGQRIKGQKTPDLDQLPDRAANPKIGKEVYAVHCAVCHGENGAGMRMPGQERGYLYPPLWGDDSFNDGAGMHRLLTAARFIKANMPTGTTYEDPQLTDEEAYDVAAYINTLTRPHKANREKDYPDLSKKPIDAPFGPYGDDIPQEQHKFGPYNF